MRTHKTYSGMIRAAERVISSLEFATIREEHEYAAYSERVDLLRRELTALWSNPAQAHEAAVTKNRLLDAWNKAIG